MSKQTKNLDKKAAETPTAVNSIIGVQRSEFMKSAISLLGYAAKQPAPFARHVSQYGKELVKILSNTSELSPDKRDRRFQDTTWQSNKMYKYGLQSWLAARQILSDWIDESDLDEERQAKAHFITNLLTDTLAPTNTLLGNPAAMKRLYETGGKSAIAGLKNLLDDMRNNGGMPSMVDKSPFSVGENLATTEGSVIYKNEMCELIQYKSSAKVVYQIPLVIIPPQINKYYILDMSPEKSMVKYFADLGYQVFMISWNNPQKQHSHWGLANYVQSLIEATDAVLSITKSKKINISGACSGGITATSFASELAARDDTRINSLSLMVCVLDPKKTDSDMGIFVSDKSIESARRKSKKNGMLSGEQLSKSFAWMRPNDLIWNYVVNNYLLGNSPPVFDVLFWNGDTTNLPAQLHSDYLDMFSDQRFLPDSNVEFMGHVVDLKKIDQDIFMMGAVTDHITPWKSCYRNIDFFGGNVEFILSNSGHVQALLNPPGNPKSTFFTNKKNLETAEEWHEKANQVPGSWWPYWGEWLKERSGPQKNNVTKPGNKSHPEISPAPGTYIYS